MVNILNPLDLVGLLINILKPCNFVEYNEQLEDKLLCIMQV